MKGFLAFVAFGVVFGSHSFAQAHTSALNPLLQYETDLAPPLASEAVTAPLGANSEPSGLVTEPAKRDENSGEARPPEAHPTEAPWATSSYYKNGMPI